MSKPSMVDPRWRLLAQLRLYCNSSCIAAMFLGCLVLFGWVFHIGTLKWVFPGPGSMKANTALGLILLGASLWLLLPDPPRRQRRYFGLFLAALAASIGAFTLIKYISGLNLRVDEILISFDAIATAPAVRMTPSTASIFLALGLALLLLDWKTWQGQWLAQVLSLWGALDPRWRLLAQLRLYCMTLSPRLENMERRCGCCCQTRPAGSAAILAYFLPLWQRLSARSH